MAKRLPIRPVISRKANKNVHEYWDFQAQVWIKCAGFDIHLWDSITQTKVKRRIKADYEAAKLALQDMLRVQQEVNTPLPIYIKRQQVRTISDLFERYRRVKSEPSLRNRQTRSPLTVERTRAAVKALNTTMDGDLKLSAITPAKIEAYIKRRLETGHSKGGINVDLRTLKALFSWGVKRDYLDTNPFVKVDMFQVALSTPRPLTPEELERLFTACRKGSRWYPLVMVYLLTGARLSEVLKPKLSWEDIDLENGILTLPFRKGQKSTEFPIESELLEIFHNLKANPYTKANSNLPEDADYPFPFNASYVDHKIKAILNDADIDATAHDLRDSFVSHLIYLGYSLEDVSKIAGHSTIKVTERHYYAQLQERRRSMLADLGSYLARSQPGGRSEGVSKTSPENG